MGQAGNELRHVSLLKSVTQRDSRGTLSPGITCFCLFLSVCLSFNGKKNYPFDEPDENSSGDEFIKADKAHFSVLICSKALLIQKEKKGKK